MSYPKIVVLSLVFMLAFSCLCAAYQQEKNAAMVPLKGKNFQTRIDTLVQEGRFDEAAKMSEQFEAWAKAQDPKLGAKFVEAAQVSQVEIQEKAGNYEAAAVSAEKAGKETKSEVMQKKAEASKLNLASQKESFDKQMALSEKIVDKDMEIYKIVKQQKAELEGFLAKNPAPVSKEKLAELQKFMKKTTAEIAAKTKERDAIAEDLGGLRDTFKNVPFSKDLRDKLDEKYKKLDNLARDLDIAQADMNIKYGDLSEKFKVDWTGFADKITETHQMQKEMLDLQKKMKELAGKGNLSAADQKAFTDLKRQYGQLKSQVDAKIKELQKTFEDASTFADLNSEQAARLKGLFQDIKKNKTFLEENEKKLEVAGKKATNVLYGDANGDGVVDQADTNVINTILRGKLPKGTKVDLLAADVNGDGKITREDYDMLQQKLWGFRKTFPVDPKNLPGDMNGNGKIDREDVQRVDACAKDPESRMASFRNVADMNGDGKVDDADRNLVGSALKAQAAKDAEEDAKVTADTSSDQSGGDKEKTEKRQAPSSGNPFQKGKK